MKIKSITISGLRSFGPEPVTLELGPRTVLIGPHGAGKSTVIMALEMLHAMANGRSHEMPCLYDDEWPSDTLPDISVSAELEGDTINRSSRVDIAIVRNHGPRPWCSIRSEKFTQRYGESTQEYEFIGQNAGRRKEQSYEVRQEFDALLSIHKYTNVGQTYLPAAVLGGSDAHASQIAHEFKTVYGDFTGFEKFNQLSMVPTVGIRETNGRLTLLRHLSVGMRTYLGLLAFLMTAGGERKGIMLIEEPDAGLHPDLLHHLAGVIKRASEHCQIVMTTNNPGMLSEFSETPEDVVVVERPFDHTELKRLERGPLEHWLKDYGLGHAWESGAIGGRMEVI